MPLHQQHGDLGNHETNQVGPAITGKNQAARKVPEQETSYRAYHRKTKTHQFRILHFESDIAHGKEDKDRNDTGQSIVAINNVNRMRYAANSNNSQQQH
ncbi:hypothetical protein A203_20340 [Chromobacterium violaceum]